MRCHHFDVCYKRANGLQRMVVLVLGCHLAAGVGAAWAQNGSYQGLVDLRGKTSVVKSKYYFDRRYEEMRLTASIKNISGKAIRTPIVLAVSGLPADVSLSGPDGHLPDGTPFLDFTDRVPGGQLLQPGASTDVRQVAFYCPARDRLSPTFSVWGQPPLAVTASASPTTGPIPLAVAFAATTFGNVVL